MMTCQRCSRLFDERPSHAVKFCSRKCWLDAVRSTPVIDRLMSHVVVIDTGCWIWTAKRSRTGYGQFRHDGQMRSAHRVMYELSVGPVADGLDLDHLCRVRYCVNPRHMEPVTRRENMLRGDLGKDRWYAGKPYCRNGHDLTVPNAFNVYASTRRCRLCSIEYNRARWQTHLRSRVANGGTQ